MAFSVSSVRLLSYVHLVLGILAIAAGIASMNVTDYYRGLFGMGIWLGSWVLLTGLAGVASSLKPGNFCRIGIFLGCCLVAIVLMSICSIIIGTVVIRYFQFESTVTRDFYKGKGTFGQENHDDYYKPEEDFADRRESGMIGLAVYGSLLAINICDVLLCCASVYVCRDLARNEQAANRENISRGASLSRHTQGNAAAAAAAAAGRNAQLGYGGQNWAELVFQGMPQSLQPMSVQFIHNQDLQFFTPYKLPNYAELYPEGIVNPSVAQCEQQCVPDEPPPEYIPAANAAVFQHSVLPGSSVELPLSSVLPSTEGNTTVQESMTSVRPDIVPETTGVLENSSLPPELLEVVSTPVYETSSTPNTGSAVSVSSTSSSLNSLPNAIQVNTPQVLDNAVCGDAVRNGSDTR